MTSLYVRPLLLDAFCGAGGAAKGYYDAGFDVIGVDIKPQKRYPYRFVQGDALEYIARYGCYFDAIHASPPCQAHSLMRKGRWQEREHANLIPETRQLLQATGKPWVIENVEGARAEMIAPVMLCGTMFWLQTDAGSQLRRHRLFETSFDVLLVPPCNHKRNASVIGVYGGGQHPQRRRVPVTIGVYGHSGGSSNRDSLDYSCFTTDDRRAAMGIDWMTGAELSQAIPPAYTRFIGAYLRRAVGW